MTRSHQLDGAVIACLLAYSFLIWWPTRSLPHHWDSAAFVIRSAQDLFSHRFLPLVATHSEFAHPPLIPMLVALSWLSFGQTLSAAHLILLPFLCLYLLSSYYLGKKIAPRRVALAATLPTGAVPVVLAETGMVYLDLPLAALTVTALAAWFYDRPLLSAFFLLLASLTKMTVLPVAAVLLFFTLTDPQKRRRWQSYVPVVAPLLGAGLYLYYHHEVTGWWLTAPGRETVSPRTVGQLLNSVKFVAYVFFARQYRWVLTLFALTAALLMTPDKRQKIFHRQFVRLLISLLFLGLFLFAASGEYIPRYSLYLLPLFNLLSLFLVYEGFPRHLFIPFVIGLMFAFYLAGYPTRLPTALLEFRLNEDLSYRDHIETGFQAANFLQRQPPGTTIIGSFPQEYQLTEPVQGYVDHPLRFMSCQDYPTHPVTGLLYLHPYHYTQLACQDILNHVNATPAAEFETNGVWAKLYEIRP